MAHSFLIEPGSWTLQGDWIEGDGQVIPVKGKTLISWGKDDWFVMVTKLIFESDRHPEIICRYKGRFDGETQHYNFVLDHSLLGNLEGEGWLTERSVIQRYWVLQDNQRRTGLDTMTLGDRQAYTFSSTLMTGHRLNTVLEGTLARATH